MHRPRLRGISQWWIPVADPGFPRGGGANIQITHPAELHCTFTMHRPRRTLGGESANIQFWIWTPGAGDVSLAAPLPLDPPLKSMYKADGSTSRSIHNIRILNVIRERTSGQTDEDLKKLDSLQQRIYIVKFWTPLPGSKFFQFHAVLGKN